MKIDIKIVVLIIVGIFLFQHFFPGSDEPIEDVTIITPEEVGEVKKVVDSIATDTIYIDRFLPGKVLPARTELVVDSLYKAKYEEAVKDNDSLAAKNLFLESIALDTYEGNLIDNKDIRIDGKFLTRGKLLEYDVTYKIKSDTITYTPEIVTRYPKFSLVGGIELGLPTDPLANTNPLISAHIGFRNKKGNTLSVGMDSERRVTVGYEITLFKTKK